MTTITIELSKDQDLSAVEEGLQKMGLKFRVDEDEDDEDWGDLPEAAIEGIKAGLADIEAGRVHTHEEVMAYMHEKYSFLKKKDA